MEKVHLLAYLIQHARLSEVDQVSHNDGCVVRTIAALFFQVSALATIGPERCAPIARTLDDVLEEVGGVHDEFADRLARKEYLRFIFYQFLQV
jgi:hypothetical protein